MGSMTCFTDLKSTSISPQGTAIGQKHVHGHSGPQSTKITNLRYLDDITMDYGSVKHYMLTGAIDHDHVRSYRAHFDRGGELLSHIDYFTPLSTPL